jgi:predicted O-methyltransferase YrrM
LNRREELLTLANSVKGFMPRNEGLALFELALEHGLQVPSATWLEIGAWCGKSAIYLGAAAEETNAVLYSLDHHHGSEENQEGWEHFDASLVDPVDGRLNTLPTWQRSISDAQLEQTVIGLIGHSSVVARHFDQLLDLLFIDGGHAREVAWADYRSWATKVVGGGLLMIHDVFADPADGGQVPYEIYQAALSSGQFDDVAQVGSLRVLRRVTTS